MRHLLRTYLVAAALAPSAALAQFPADLIIHNARIYTVDESKPLAEAMAVSGDRIVFVGSDREADVYRGKKTTVIDLQGKTVLPVSRTRTSTCSASDRR